MFLNRIIHVLLAVTALISQVSKCAAVPSKTKLSFLSQSERESLSLPPSISASQVASLDRNNVNAVNPGFNSGSCPLSPNGYTHGWHFVLSDLSQSFLTIHCQFAKAGVITEMVQEPCGMHAYVYTPSGDTLLAASANVTGSSRLFTLNDVCSPPSEFPVVALLVFLFPWPPSVADPCLEDNGGCDVNALCSDETSTNKVQCTCKTGYEKRGPASNVTCVDSCTINDGGCGPNTICSHHSASFAIKCRCKMGYTNIGTSSQLNCIGNRYRCVLRIVQRFFSHPLDSCSVNNGGCSDNALCNHHSATYVAICLCKPGYVNVGSSSNVVCTGSIGRHQ